MNLLEYKNNITIMKYFFMNIFFIKRLKITIYTFKKKEKTILSMTIVYCFNLKI